MKELTNPVTAYRITLLDDTADQVFGRIELLNAGKSKNHEQEDECLLAPNLNSTYALR